GSSACLFKWNSHEDGSATTFLSVDANLTSNQQRSFSHPQQAERPRISHLIISDSAAIVFDFHFEIIHVATRLDVKISGTCMAQNVRQYFLKDAKHRGRPFTS